MIRLRQYMYFIPCHKTISKAVLWPILYGGHEQLFSVLISLEVLLSKLAQRLWSGELTYCAGACSAGQGEQSVSFVGIEKKVGSTQVRHAAPQLLFDLKVHLPNSCHSFHWISSITINIGIYCLLCFCGEEILLKVDSTSLLGFLGVGVVEIVLGLPTEWNICYIAATFQSLALPSFSGEVIPQVELYLYGKGRIIPLPC